MITYLRQQRATDIPFKVIAANWPFDEKPTEKAMRNVLDRYNRKRQ
jgi:hypothetical protein